MPHRTAVTSVSLALGLLATGVAAVPARDSATIHNSGSTNFAGYSIEVWSDGAATVSSSNRMGDQLSTPKPFTYGAKAASQFFTDLAAARAAAAGLTQPCMKSASFGSTTRVTWHDWTSPDLSCPPGNAAGAALVRDVDAVTQASGITATPQRSGPIMHRASPATPEPSPTAS